MSLFVTNFQNYGKHPLRLFDELFDDLIKVKDEENEFKIPIYDVIENDNEYLIEMSLAGVKRDDITLNVENNELIIVGQRKEIKDIKYNRKQS